MRLILPSLLLSVLAGPAHSQDRPFLQLAGTIRDSATAHAIPRLYVCAYVTTYPRGGPATLLSRCAAVDTLGTFLLDSIPRNWEWLQVACVGHWGKSIPLLNLSSRGHALPASPWKPVLSSGTCDLRPTRAVSGRFAGLYTGGFEESSFRRCDYPRQAIWLSFGPEAMAQYRDALTALPADTVPHPIYLEARGTLTGPGVYGHMGSAEYELHVDSVYQVGGTTPADCQ
jgi:hypothetical protein